MKKLNLDKNLAWTTACKQVDPEHEFIKQIKLAFGVILVD